MSGHSKWATTKHKKAVVDARRGKLFARLIKNIEVAARMGGGDVNGNPTLYDAVQKARKNSVPLDNIERAVKRGSGAEAGGADWQTIMYEGYGPSGVALLVECLTDNRNRAATDVRVALTRNGGSMADPGSVSYMFARKGVVIVPKTEGMTEDDILMVVLDAGAEEVNDLGESFEVVSEATDMVGVRKAIQEAGLDYESAEANFLPQCQRRPRRGGRAQGVPPDRGARGQRRRAERVRQLRRQRRRHGSGRLVVNDFVGTQLRGWDAATFRTASGDPTMRSTVVALTILESAPEWARLRQRVDRLTLFVPALRMRPLFGALGMTRAAPRRRPELRHGRPPPALPTA